ncbi:MAG: diguanylate cyclase, partial [Spirochaetales bacterium]|nr:diguanylate cyclase [Spirochaetales bacterium]
EIVLTDKIPIGSGEYLTPEYDRTLCDAGVFPWFWDLRKNRILLTPNILRILPGTTSYGRSLYPIMQEHLSHEEANHLFKIIKAFVRQRTADDYDFQLKNTGYDSPWMRISGTYLKEGKKIVGVMGNLRNINESVILQKDLKESRNFLDTLINLIPLPVYYKNRKGEYQFYNRAFAKLVSARDRNLKGKTVYDVYDREQADSISQSDEELIRNKEVQIYKDEVYFKDGRNRDLSIHKAPDLDSVTSEVKGVAGFILDNTEQNRADRRIRRLLDIKELVLEINHAILSIPDLESLLEFVLEKIPTVIKNADCGTILLHKDGMLTVTACYGYVAEKMTGYSFPLDTTFMYQEAGGIPQDAIIINDLQQLIARGDFPPLLPTKSGKSVQSFLGSPITRGGKLLGIFSMDSFTNNSFREEDIEVMEYLNEQLAVILDKQELYQKVLGLSRFDSLTSLSNRHYFQEQANAAMSRAGRNSESLVILLADLDSLKPVNDFWGHDAGDDMIRCFSTLLKDSFRDSDILGRIGGDEFTAVFHDTDRINLEARFQEFYNNPRTFNVPEGQVPCRFSFGTAEFPSDGSTLEELIKVADQRMYVMKQQGKKTRVITYKTSLLIQGK